MKTSKKIVALLLALVVAIGLCACSSTNFDNLGNKDNDALVGTWKTEIDMTGAIGAGIGGAIDVSGIKTKVMVPMIMTFEKDAKVTLKMDMNAAKDSVSSYLKEAVEPLAAALYDQGKQSGMTEEEFDAAFQEQYGMGVREYCEDQINKLDLDDMLNAEDTTVEGCWELKGEKLYLADTEKELEDLDHLEYVKVKISGDKMTLDEGNGNSFSDFEEIGITLPLEFKKA